MNPITPMEPVYSDVIPTGPLWTASIKWDGVRILCYANGQDTRLYNRHQRERTFHYPELTAFRSYCHAASVILDGEVIALGPDGKPSFHEVMRRDGLRTLTKVPHVQKTTPIAYMVFDILYHDGRWVTEWPFEERMHLLGQSITPNSSVQLVESHGDGAQLFDVVRQHDLEGVVVKQTDSSYRIGEKVAAWRKIKNYKDLFAVIGGYTVDNGRINAVLLGLFEKNGELHYVGHVGPGKLGSAEWRDLTRTLESRTVRAMPFANKPPRVSQAVWTEPLCTLKIRFMEWTAHRSLRQPTVQGIVDVDPGTCTFDS